MATYLYRLGGWAFQNRWKVVTVWAAVLIGVILCAYNFAGSTNDEFSVPGTESQEAQDLASRSLPGCRRRLCSHRLRGTRRRDTQRS